LDETDYGTVRPFGKKYGEIEMILNGSAAEVISQAKRIKI
jgi:hypothetical protein